MISEVIGNHLAMYGIPHRGLQVLLILLYAAAFVIGIVRAKGKLHSPFGGLCVLCVCPFVACALVSLLRLHEIIDIDSRAAIGNLGDKLREAQRPALLGLATSIAMLLLHAALYLTQRVRSASVQLTSKNFADY